MILEEKLGKKPDLPIDQSPGEHWSNRVACVFVDRSQKQESQDNLESIRKALGDDDMQ
jgi:hypothetical protein